MSYSVLWMPAAEERLASIWVHADDRNEITQAAHRIDQTLRADPEDAGESRSGEMRLLLAPPLGVLFLVSPDDRRVSVLTVWRFDRRGFPT